MKKVMRIVLALVLIAVMAVTFVGCGNVSLGLGNFEFNKVHVDTYHYSGCLEVDKLYETSTGVEIKTKSGESIYLSEGTYIMVEDECPFCRQ